MDYKEKLELARDWYNDQSTTKKEKVLLENLFPELAESEDEKIRRALIRALKNLNKDHYDMIYLDGFSIQQCLAWLEKQGEPQPYRGNADTMRKNLIKTFKSVGSKYWGGFDVRDIIHFLESKDAIELEKQGEQKPVDKIEPWFKVGDWIVYETEEWRDVLQIETIESERYTFTNGSSSSYDEEQNMRLWTIEDAREGDVLYCKGDDIEYIVMSKGVQKFGNIDSYFRYNSLDGFGVDIPSVLSTRQDNITPATKEQRDLLFSKMKEAGYEWNAEKKELKKIEKNLAWSNDDEKILGKCIDAASGYYSPEDKQSMKDWLKSFKKRVQPHWKPTEEQLMALRDAIDNNEMKSLYEELVKL